MGRSFSVRVPWKVAAAALSGAASPGQAPLQCGPRVASPAAADGRGCVADIAHYYANVMNAQ